MPVLPGECVIIDGQGVTWIDGLGVARSASHDERAELARLRVEVQQLRFLCCVLLGALKLACRDIQGRCQEGG